MHNNSSISGQSKLSLYIEELGRFAFVDATPGTEPSYRIIGTSTSDVLRNKMIYSEHNDVDASALCRRNSADRYVINNNPTAVGQCLYTVENNKLEWADSGIKELGNVAGQLDTLENKFVTHEMNMRYKLAQVDKLLDELKMGIEIVNEKIRELGKGSDVVDATSQVPVSGTEMTNMESKKILDQASPIIDSDGTVHISGDICANLGALTVAVRALQRK